MPFDWKEMTDDCGRVWRWGQMRPEDDHCSHMLTFGQYRVSMVHSLVDRIHRPSICDEVNTMLLQRMEKLCEEEAQQCLNT